MSDLAAVEKILGKYPCDLEEVKEYLNTLRDSGETNMFGAASYLIRDFGIPAKDAKPIVLCYLTCGLGDEPD